MYVQCQRHLSDLGIILKFFEFILILLYEVFEHCVVAVHAVLSPGQIHPSLHLLHV